MTINETNKIEEPVQNNHIDVLADTIGPAFSRQHLTIDGARISNYSALPTAQLLNMLPRSLKYEEVVFMPDVCPGKSPLPTGTALRTFDPNWRQYAISDCGCGMQLLKTGLSFEDFDSKIHLWDKLGLELRKNKGGLGDLGGGNHFVDAIVDYSDHSVNILIHTGSRLESGLVDHLVDKPLEFEKEFDRIIGWAKDNRDCVADAVKKIYGDCECKLDLAHNTYEKLNDGSVVIRKGVIKVKPGEQIILPSHMSGDIALLQAQSGVTGTLHSLSHGTGRAMSRSEAKEIPVNFEELRQSIYIPNYINNSSIKTEAPHCYRSLDSCIDLLGPLVREEARFAVVAYLGRL